MTDLSVHTVSYSADGRDWLWGDHGTEEGDNPSIVLDMSTFPAGMYPNGVIPSGCVVGQITASGLYGPYDAAATDGRQTAAGLTFDAVPVMTTAAASSRIGNALFVHGFVNPAKLPYQSGPGGISDAAKTALTLIYWK